jgi:hypothetical protein
MPFALTVPSSVPAFLSALFPSLRCSSCAGAQIPLSLTAEHREVGGTDERGGMPPAFHRGK